MNFRKPTDSDKKSAIDLAPIVDVVFNLLIFFATSTSPYRAE